MNGVSCLVVAENCLDRHAEEAGGRAALIWEKDEPGQHEIVTYQWVGWGWGWGDMAQFSLVSFCPCVFVWLLPPLTVC